jgi:selenium-binding protein 1
VQLCRDVRRVYGTNSLSSAVDDQFYPDGVKGWMAKIDVDAQTGAMRVDTKFFPEFDGMRPHQARLEGGDASSDSFCYA